MTGRRSGRYPRAGDTAAFFRALEHVIGKPRQAVELAQNQPAQVVFCWKDDLTTNLEEGQKRVAKARDSSGG